MLNAAEARMFHLLRVHPGRELGVPVAAAGGGVEVSTASQMLDSMVSAHLLTQTGPERYQFVDRLDEIATNAASQVESLESEQYEVLARILAWYLHNAYAASAAVSVWGRILTPTVLPAPNAMLRFDDRATAVQWFDREWPNLVPSHLPHTTAIASISMRIPGANPATK